MTNWNEILGEYKDMGFSLREPDDHILELYFKDKGIARFNQAKATTEVIIEGCKNYTRSLLKQIRGDL